MLQAFKLSVFAPLRALRETKNFVTSCLCAFVFQKNAASIYTLRLCSLARFA
jgi:hypothetical protein